MQGRVPTHAEVQQALTEVLARPEFSDRPANALVTFLAGLRAAAREAVLTVLERLIPSAGVGTILVQGVQLALALGALLLGGFLLSRLFRTGALPRARRPGTGAPAAPDPPEDWAAAAETAARQGRYRQAALALYQALLDRLDRGGLIRIDPAKTPGDYRRELRRTSPAPAFDAFCRIFEPLAFGRSVPDRTAYERLSAAAAEAYRE